MLGDPSLLAKTVVEIEGISQRLSGKYYLHEAKHKIDGSGFTVELKALRDGHGAPGVASKGKQNKERAGDDPGALQPFEAVDREHGGVRYEFRDVRGRPTKGGK